MEELYCMYIAAGTLNASISVVVLVSPFNLHQLAPEGNPV
jgi:hypothetical protein